MSQKKILIVDDSKVTRRSVQLLLEKYGLEVLTLDRVEDLLTFAENYREVNLIFLDINLPGMDGLTALEYINQLSSLNHIPVIIISGHSGQGIIKRASSLNVVDYVLKPYLADRLLAKIEKVLGPLTLTTETEQDNIVSPDDDKNLEDKE